MEPSSSDGYWSWADFSHREIVEGRARGNRRSLWLRARIQTFLFKLGNFAQNHSASVLMIGLVILTLCTLGLFMKAKLETNVEKLWMKVGGHLENELAYSKEFGSDYVSYEMIIQTPNSRGTNVLTASALLEHVDFVKKAMKVEVKVFDVTWTIDDLCVKPNVPELNPIMNKVLEQLMPCIIITPLDCFWDGGKIHPQNVTAFHEKIRWTNFDPQNFVNKLVRELQTHKIETFDMSKMKSMLIEGGISHGYMRKPCLNPTESGCPDSAPNKASKKKPDIGQELTGGCKGFAEKLMEWPEDIIVGGVRKNESGVIRSAEALQTVINLMDEKNLHKFWVESNGYLKAKVQHIIDWDIEKARQVLHAWQREFVKVVNESPRKGNKQNVMAFSTTTFNDLLKHFSAPNQGLIACGYVLMLVYACFTMIRWNSIVQSQGCMGILGVLLVSLSVAAGLGICAFLGISFNAASTQVLPFLALGLGVDDMFLLSHTFRDLNSRNLRSKEHAGYCLSTTGVSIMLTSFTNAAAFFMAAIIPIPALRALCLKAGIIIIFNFLAIVIIYPAMIAMDVRRRENQRYDIFCCVQKDSHTRVTQIRPGTNSYDNSMVTINHTSDEDSSLHQIPTASANVSMGQPSGDVFVLPGVALKASANCNFNEALCSGMLGGDIMALPGMSNIVVSVSSGHNIEGETSHNANANIMANISNSGKGRSMNINASSNSSSSMRPDGREQTSKHGIRDTSSSVNHGSQADCAPTATVYSRNEGKSQRFGHSNMNESRSSNRKGFAESSINISQNYNRECGSNQNGKGASQFGYFQASANAVADSSQGEPSCSSNAEVILRPEKARSSRSQGNSQRNKSRGKMAKSFARFSLGYLTKKYYAPSLQKISVKILVLFLSAIIFSVAIYGCLQVKDGMDITDVVPKGTKTSDFLEARNKYFSFYDIVIVTKGGFNYPYGQEKLYELHKKFAKVDTVVKLKNNTLPKFWLMYFRDWLSGLQEAFDSDWKKGVINYSGPLVNASTDGKLAYKLLLHTGDPNDPNQHQKVNSVRLVDNHGIIHYRGFYNFLRAWKNMDPMGYEMSQAQIKPEIESWTDARDRNIISAAKPIKYARMPFYLTGLKDTEDYVRTIKEVREICDRFNDEGVPNYPRGVPFTFWEQYLWLRKQLFITVGIVLLASFIVISGILVNVWAGSIVVAVLLMTTVELYGFLGLVGIKLSAIPAVTLIFSIGVGVEFTVHLCMVFVTSVGDRNQRLQQALETVLSPVVDGAISTILGIIMLAGSEFDFVVKYFFHVLAALIVIGFLNGVVLLPVILSLIGPNPEVVPIRELSASASTKSWLGLMPIDRNTFSSVSNLSGEPSHTGRQETSTEADDVHLQIMPIENNCTHDSKTKKFKRDVSPRQYYGKNIPRTTESPKQAFSSTGERRQPGPVLKNAPSVAKWTATATVTVEVHKQDDDLQHAIVPRSSVESDLKVVDCEEEFV